MLSRGNLGKPLDRTECLQQVTRRNRADMATAKAEEETRCIRLPSRLDGGQQVFDRFLLPSFPAVQFLPFVVQSRSEEHTSELQSLMRISFAVFSFYFYLFFLL